MAGIRSPSKNNKTELKVYVNKKKTKHSPFTYML
jgi:hypothetical protein